MPYRMELFISFVFFIMNEENRSNGQFGSTCSVRLTSSALMEVKRAILEECVSSDTALRVAVKGGGCVGLQYALDFSIAKREEDVVLNFDGLVVFIDFASSYLLRGTEIDYLSGVQGSGFKFNNPNERRKCACSMA